MRVADLILDVLSAHGVRDVFGVPGDAINDITYALKRRDDMRFILVRHEWSLLKLPDQLSQKRGLASLSK